MSRLKAFITSFMILAISLIAADSSPIINPIPIHEAFVPKYSDITPIVPITRAPPANKPENIPSQPIPDAVWVSGYWAWIQQNNDFAWICGVWRRPPPGTVWVPGYWYNTQGSFNYAWIRGFWSPVAQDKLTYIPKPPPNTVNETIPSAPSANHFWAQGYWNYNAATASYGWLGGVWKPADPNWVLAPSNYVWRPQGYIFIPFTWDYPIDKRGVAYSCDDPIGIIEPTTIIRQLFFYYPDYIGWYWHWWHYHPDFWHDCWCMPPWWGWGGWWGIGWHDHWWLWWWWAHPGFPAPWWLSLEMSSMIAPPLDTLYDLFGKVKPPFFITPHGIPQPSDWLDLLGNKPLIPNDLLDHIEDDVDDKLPQPGTPVRPTGPRDVAPIPPPVFPAPPSGNRVTPPAPPQVTPPSVTVPPVPSPQAPPEQTPPQYYPPSTPPTYGQPPQYTPPPQYVPPPQYTPPPQYIPPRGGDDFDWDHNDRHPPGDRNPPSRTPPGNPPRYPPSPNYNPPTPNYTPPTPNYTPPTPNYNPPKPNYTPPTPNYNPPRPNYNPPTPNVTPPTPNYNPPSQNRTPSIPRDGQRQYNPKT